MKTNLISKSETAQVLKIVSEKWRIDIPKVKNLKVYEIDNETQLITGKDIKILKIYALHILARTFLLHGRETPKPRVKKRRSV